jgi:hypothetical protein
MDFFISYSHADGRSALALEAVAKILRGDYAWNFPDPCGKYTNLFSDEVFRAQTQKEFWIAIIGSHRVSLAKSLPESTPDRPSHSRIGSIRERLRDVEGVRFQEKALNRVRNYFNANISLSSRNVRLILNYVRRAVERCKHDFLSVLQTMYREILRHGKIRVRAVHSFERIQRSTRDLVLDFEIKTGNPPPACAIDIGNSQSARCVGQDSEAFHALLWKQVSARGRRQASHSEGTRNSRSKGCASARYTRCCDISRGRGARGASWQGTPAQVAVAL